MADICNVPIQAGNLLPSQRLLGEFTELRKAIIKVCHPRCVVIKHIVVVSGSQ
jgi:hypothetical protein